MVSVVDTPVEDSVVNGLNSFFDTRTGTASTWVAICESCRVTILDKTSNTSGSNNSLYSDLALPFMVVGTVGPTCTGCVQIKTG